MKMREWFGRRVQLKYDIETRGGEELAAGAVLTVKRTHRGKLTLADDQGRLIRRVRREYVELLPQEGRS